MFLLLGTQLTWASREEGLVLPISTLGRAYVDGLPN